MAEKSYQQKFLRRQLSAVVGLLLLALAAARPRPHHRLARGGAAWSADEARYSRQLLAFGRDAHARLRRARVLVAGADAVGAEVAKDLALLGVAAVDVFDGEMNDLDVTMVSGKFTQDEDFTIEPEIEI